MTIKEQELYNSLQIANQTNERLRAQVKSLQGYVHQLRLQCGIDKVPTEADIMWHQLHPEQMGQ